MMSLDSFSVALLPQASLSATCVSRSWGSTAYKNARGPIRSWNFCNDHYNEHKSDRLGDTVYCLPLNCLLVYNADYWTAVDFFHRFEELEEIHLKVDGNHVLKMFNFLNI